MEGMANNKMAAMICVPALQSNKCEQPASITYYQLTSMKARRSVTAMEKNVGDQAFLLLLLLAV